MKKLVLLIFLCFSIGIKSQVNLSVYSEVSIVTAGPGDQLFEAFGHSAIRIKDPLLRLDLVYNYGIFDFNAPNFYTNFTKGKLLYKLGRYPFKYFLESYREDKRWVKEQLLNLSQQEKQAFFMYLEKNAAPQNASYLYDPYYNNCATKLRDITKNVLGDKVDFVDETISQKETLRTLMNDEIHWNTWGSFGINLALGKKLDKTATTEEYMYLPDFVYEIYKNSTITIDGKKENLVKKENTLLEFKEIELQISIFNPFLIFTIISLLGIWVSYNDYKKQKRTKLLDFLLLFTTGLIGLLLVFLWFFTDHSTTPNNLNILWAFAPNLVVSFLMLVSKPRKWLKQYFKLLLVLILSIPIIWISSIQLFPVAVIPILLLLAIRYFFLTKSL